MSGRTCLLSHHQRLLEGGGLRTLRDGQRQQQRFCLSSKMLINYFLKLQLALGLKRLHGYDGALTPGSKALGGTIL